MRMFCMRRELLYPAAALVGLWALSRTIRSAVYDLRDKAVVITGGSRGLGLVLARQICAHGGRVLLVARETAELDRAKGELSEFGDRRVQTFAADLTDPAQARAIAAEARQRFGRVDILINNAGIIQVSALADTNRTDFEQAMALHFWAPYQLMMEIIPLMQRQRGGRIVNISSIGGKIAVPHLAPYCASKFALTGLSDSLRAELSRDDIYITTVAPGLMRTGSHINAFFKGRHSEEFAWFSLGNATPGLSMSAERAARKIIAAFRRGQPSLTLTMAARGAIAANAVMPNTVGYAMKLVNRFLPAPGEGMDAGHITAGRNCRRLIPRWLTTLSDEASFENNEVGAAD